MGKRSIKEDKNIYQLAREEADLTRAEASEALEFISENKLANIEYDKTPAQPDEILAMAKAYKKPSLCNYYCSNECPIGQELVPEIKPASLAEIVLEMLSDINSVNKTKERLIEITADGVVDDDELADFVRIQKELEALSLSVDSLNLWVDEMISSGKIDAKKLKKLQDM
ncbi:MAG: helix-turn-helix transcriptional regulator [Lachnospiraceae bacterium]|nr:helix-turn-helix transcriptional regulator [Lachnospiraceae bacterium]